MPQWKLRPEKSVAEFQPNGLRFVLFEGSRSAEPPTRNGTSAARAHITAPQALRVARGLEGSKTGSFASSFCGR